MQWFLTNIGRERLIDQNNLGLHLVLDSVALGTAKYNAEAEANNATALKQEVVRQPLAGGMAETKAQELRVNAIIQANLYKDIYEIGLFTNSGDLFAIASTEGNDPLLRLAPNVGAVLTMSIHLDGIKDGQITLNLDPNSPLAVELLSRHTAENDPHPQYSRRDTELEARIYALEARIYEETKVGDLFLTMLSFNSGEEVRQHKGYGRWEKVGNGQALVAHGDHTRPEFMRTVGQSGGEDMHRLTENELPAHYHKYNGDDQYANPAVFGDDTAIKERGVPYDAYSDFSSSVGGVFRTSVTGNNDSHNNIQQSLTIGVWQRLSDFEESFKLYANKNTVGEKEKILITLETQNIPNGKVFPFFVEGLDQQSFLLSNSIFHIGQSGNAKAVVEFTVNDLNTQYQTKEIIFRLQNGKANLALKKQFPDRVFITITLDEKLLPVVQTEENKFQVIESINLYNIFMEQVKREPRNNDYITFHVPEHIIIVGRHEKDVGVHPAILNENKWPTGTAVKIENYGFILGRGANATLITRNKILGSDHLYKPLGGDAIKNDSPNAIIIANMGSIYGGGGRGAFIYRKIANRYPRGFGGAGAPYGRVSSTEPHNDSIYASLRTPGLGSPTGDISANYPNRLQQNQGRFGGGGTWGEDGESIELDSNLYHTDMDILEATKAGRVFLGKVKIEKNTGILKGRDIK